MSTAAKRVLDKVEAAREEILDFVACLVRFKSINALMTSDHKPLEERACQEFMAEKLRDLGMTVDLWEHDPKDLEKYGGRYLPRESYKDRPCLVGVLKGRGDGRSLILSGHADVVPADPEDLWTHNPWHPTILDGKMYGRGTADMKAGLGSMIWAVECIQRADIDLLGDVQIHSTIDEEFGNTGALCVVDRGYRADGCIVTEPTDLSIQPKHKGILWLRVDVRGRSGHAQIPPQHWTRGGTVSAIDKATYVKEGLERLNDEWCGRRGSAPRPDKVDPDGLLSVPHINVDVIRGGTEPHIVPETCYLRADIQYLPHEGDQEKLGSRVRSEVEEYLSSVFKGDSWLSEKPPTLSWELETDPSAIDISHPLVTTVVRSVQEAGQPSQLSGLVPYCDMARYVNVANIPTVIYGPGRLQQAHSTDEFVEVDQIIDAAKGLATAILNWCGHR